MKRELVEAGKDEISLNAFITAMVTDLVLFFNVGKTMNQQQVVSVVEIIKTDYYFLRPSEIKYCFDNAKKGYYGALYDRIDGAIIFEWLEKYLSERRQMIQDDNDRKHKEVKTNPIAMNEKVLEILNKAIEVKPAELKTVIDTNTPKRELSLIDQRIQDLFIEFDKTYDESPVGENKGKRFIQYAGKILDQSEYVEYRLQHG